MSRVLVVDDDQGVRETSVRVLREYGHDVLTAESGQKALQFTRLDPPDVMLLDYQLPDMTALEVIRTLRDSGNTFPIIVITGFGTIPSAVEAIKLGALDYLEKPLDTDQVVESVERALQGSSGHSQSVIRADGVALWATAVASVLASPRDPRTIPDWASVRGVATETLRSWCRTAGLPPKRSLDLARVLRAVCRGRTARLPAERLLRAADHRTLERLLAGAGLPKGATPPTLDEVLDRQTFIDDSAAIEELRPLLREFVVDSDE